MSEVRTLHAPFAAWLRSRGIEFLRARSDARSTIEKGWPDFSVFLSAKLPPVFIEFKAARGKESADQIRVRERLTAKGHRCYVCRSVENAIAVLLVLLDGGEHAAPAAGAGCTIRQRGEGGDWIHDGRGWVRRAVVDDYRVYRREGLNKKVSDSPPLASDNTKTANGEYAAPLG